MPIAPRRTRRFSRKANDKSWNWKQTKGPRNGGYDNDWNKLSASYRNQHPLCERCESQGRVREAQQVNHKKPFHGIDDPLRLDWNNLESVCVPCHREIERERVKMGG